MNIEQSREEFTDWLRTRPEVLNIGYDPICGKFVLREDQERWEAWQASRIPKVYREEDSEEMFQWLLRVNVFGYNDFEKEKIQELLSEIMLNKNLDVNERRKGSKK